MKRIFSKIILCYLLLLHESMQSFSNSRQNGGYPHADFLQCFYFIDSLSLASGNDGPCVTHSTTRRGTQTGYVRHDWLGVGPTVRFLEVLRRLFLLNSSNLTWNNVLFITKLVDSIPIAKFLSLYRRKEY